MSAWYRIDTSLPDGIACIVKAPKAPEGAGLWLQGPDGGDLDPATGRWKALYVQANQTVRLKSKAELEADAQSMASAKAVVQASSQALGDMTIWSSGTLEEVLAHIEASGKNLEGTKAMLIEMGTVMYHLIRAAKLDKKGV